MSENVFKVRNYSFYYGNLEAIRNVSIDIERNKITAVIGPSGCGKSTFLRSFNRMNELIGDVSHVGTILMDGQDIYDDKVDVVDLRKRVGMVFQKPNPFPKSIAENLMFGPRLHGERNKTVLNDMVEHYLKKVVLWDEVKDKLHESGFSLSGGQQQRLCIARSLTVTPDVILMDEPCSALDPIATLKIEDLMKELSKEVTIIIVTHNMQQAARISDTTAFFNTTKDCCVGELVECGETKKIFTNPTDKKTADYITGRFG